MFLQALSRLLNINFLFEDPLASLTTPLCRSSDVGFWRSHRRIRARFGMRKSLSARVQCRGLSREDMHKHLSTEVTTVDDQSDIGRMPSTLTGFRAARYGGLRAPNTRPRIRQKRKTRADREALIAIRARAHAFSARALSRRWNTSSQPEPFRSRKNQREESITGCLCTEGRSGRSTVTGSLKANATD